MKKPPYIKAKFTSNSSYVIIAVPALISDFPTGIKIIVKQRHIPIAQKIIAKGSLIATHRIALRSAPVILKPI